MTEIYGSRFRSAYGEKPARTWCDALAGIPNAQLGAGLRRCLTEHAEWPPTLPELLALCAPTDQDLGLPPEADAYREAVFLAGDRLAGNAIRPSHPAVWHAAVLTGLHLLRTDAERGREAFGKAWAKTRAMVLAGDSLEEIPRALPPPTPRPLTAEEEADRQARIASAQQRLDEMLGRRSSC